MNQNSLDAVGFISYVFRVYVKKYAMKTTNDNNDNNINNDNDD